MQIEIRAPSGFQPAPTNSYLNQSYAPLASLGKRLAQPPSRPRTAAASFFCTEGNTLDINLKQI